MKDDTNYNFDVHMTFYDFTKTKKDGGIYVDTRLQELQTTFLLLRG